MNSRALHFLLVVIAACSTAWAQEKISLEYKYPVGKTYLYTELSGANITQEMMGREMKIESKARIVTRYTADKIDAAGGMTVVYSADSMVVWSKSPMRGDTTIVFKDFIGKRSSVHLAKDGTVSDKKTIDSVSGELRMLTMGAASGNLRLPRLPGHPVAAGDKWTATLVDSSSARGFNTVTTTTLDYTAGATEKKHGHTCLALTYAGSGTLTGKGSMQGMELFVDGSTKVKGTALFDFEQGIVVADDMKMENESTIAATGTQQMTIPQTSVITVTRELRGE